MPRRVGTSAPARRREPTLRPPFAKMEDARFPCAAPFPALAMAPAPAPSRTRGAQPPVWRAGPALPHSPILLCPEEGERERNTRPASPSRDQSVSTTRSSVPRAERLLCAQGAGFSGWRHFQSGAGASRGLSLRDNLPHGGAGVIEGMSALSITFDVFG